MSSVEIEKQNVGCVLCVIGQVFEKSLVEFKFVHQKHLAVVSNANCLFCFQSQRQCERENYFWEKTFSTKSNSVSSMVASLTFLFYMV